VGKADVAKKKAKPLESGDKVRRIDSDIRSVWVITSIDHEGETADIYLKGTDLEWFKYPLAKLERIPD
jgi:hypothetical protein